MASGPPARIDRAALERILQRAAELQASEHEGSHLSPDEILSLGKEVGIPQRHLQQAILEERTRVTVADPSGLLDRMAGPATAMAQRVLQGDVERLETALVGYMEEHELLCIQRRQPGRITWEPIGGFQATIRRSTAAFGSGKRPFMLDRAKVVSATIVPLEAGYAHVTLVADLRPTRAGFIGGAAALASMGLAGAGVLLALGAFAPIAIAPVALGAGLGFGTMRQYPPRVERVHLGLERALDHLEQGSIRPGHQLPPKTPGLGSLITDEIRKAITAASERDRGKRGGRP
jgi:hypothetical protein